MAAATFEVLVQGVGAVAAKFGRLPALLRAAEARAVVRAGVMMTKRWRRAATNEILHARSDTYRSSIGASPVEYDMYGAAQVRVGIRVGSPKGGTARKYAAIQEYGGTITPVKAKMLAIPVGKALTSAGVPRYSSPEQVEGDTKWVFIKSKNPHVRAIFGVADENDEIEDVLFIGMDEVTIPARRPMGKSYDEIRPLVPGLVDEECVKAVQAAMRG